MTKSKGAILITAIWILAILTLLAIGVAFRTGLEIKLTRYNLNRIKALYIAKAGINKAITEKWIEYVKGKSLGVDAFSESWSNNKEYFKDVKVGDGFFTMSYSSGEQDRSGNEIILYGLEDETRKININSSKNMFVLRNLLLNSGLDLQQAESIVAAIEDWRDEDNIPKTIGNTGGGAEDDYYQSLDTPYFTSGQDFKAIEELLLVKGITQKLFYERLIGNVTIYGDGRININTANKDVLDAVFGIGYSQLASKILDYRRGVDGKIGTDDDRWFIIGEFVIDREKKGLVEVKNLNDDNWYGNIFGITENEYRRIRDLVFKEGILSTSSDYYRASVVATCQDVKKVITAVFKFNRLFLTGVKSFSEEVPLPDVEFLYWHEDR